MELNQFGPRSPGRLVPITGTDPVRGTWEHRAFVPDPLPALTPELSGRTYRMVAEARAALAALDSTARQLPNPSLFRRSTLQAEAQSTSALEGTYAPLEQVLTADEERPPNADLREILNYVAAADTAFGWIARGATPTLGLLGTLQGILVDGTPAQGPDSGGLRSTQVVIGRRTEAVDGAFPVEASRFVPAPPGIDLRASVSDLLDWMAADHRSEIDPVVSAAMAHYQFETLHPFHDGNGCIGRLMIVVHLLQLGLLSEPTFAVSTWFEQRRGQYDDHLLAVSATGEWDDFVTFFAAGLAASARQTQERMVRLVEVQQDMKEQIRRSPLRAETAQHLVDHAVAHPSFAIGSVTQALSISPARARSLVRQLVDLGLLVPLGGPDDYRRRYSAPAVLNVLTRPSESTERL